MKDDGVVYYSCECPKCGHKWNILENEWMTLSLVTGGKTPHCPKCQSSKILWKKKNIEEMTPEEILEEFAKVTAELESQAPKIVGSLIKVSKSSYALTKDEGKRKALLELLRTDENLRRDFKKEIFEYASAMDDLTKTLIQVEDLARLKLEELQKKQKEKQKKQKKRED